MLHSTFATIGLEGSDARALVDAVVPLLDGTRSLIEIAGTFPQRMRCHVCSLLELFGRQGLIEEIADTDAHGSEARWDAQRRFLRAFGDASGKPRADLSNCRVLVAGSEPWGATAACDLAAAGVGRIQLVEDSGLGQNETSNTAIPALAHTGGLRGEALTRALGEHAPWTEASTTRASFADGWPREIDSEWDLVLVAIPAEDLCQHLAIARAADALNLKTLTGSLDGAAVKVGPLVIPRVTACWNCCRLRLLANSPQPWAEHAVDETLRHRRPNAVSLRAELGPMAPLLGHFIALEAIKLLTEYSPSALIGRLVIQSLLTLKTSSHAIIPVPDCEVCGGAGRLSRLPWTSAGPAWSGASTEDELRDALEGWLDDRTGIVSHVVIRDRDIDDPAIPLCARALPAAQIRAEAIPAGVETTGGKGMTPVRAMIGAVGEAIERYSASNPDKARLVRAQLGDLDGAALAPRDLCLYDDAAYDRPGFPYVRFDPGRSHVWTRGKWLDDGRPVWVPASFAFFETSGMTGASLCQATTNGLACGQDVEDASLRAVFEVIERDAFLTTWFCRLPGRRLLLDHALDEDTRQVIGQLESSGAAIELYLLDVGLGIPTVLCLGLGDGARWPAVTAASAAHLDPRVAARNAVFEQAFSGPFVRRVMVKRERPIPDAPQQVRTFLDHALFYIPPSRAAAFDFLRTGSELPLSLRELPSPDEISLAACSERIALSGIRIALTDVTSADVALGPFRVVRALGTNLQALHCGYGMERCANPRLKSRLVNGVNPDLHPLC